MARQLGDPRVLLEEDQFWVKLIDPDEQLRRKLVEPLMSVKPDWRFVKVFANGAGGVRPAIAPGTSRSTAMGFPRATGSRRRAIFSTVSVGPPHLHIRGISVASVIENGRIRNVIASRLSKHQRIAVQQSPGG